ncbi:MAG: hypothetical protein KIT27_02105 [Legionellales bacterium]|nr:hypothetical protein [Legionellales bacterium]
MPRPSKKNKPSKKANLPQENVSFSWSLAKLLTAVLSVFSAPYTHASASETNGMFSTNGMFGTVRINDKDITIPTLHHDLTAAHIVNDLSAAKACEKGLLHENFQSQHGLMAGEFALRNPVILDKNYFFVHGSNPEATITQESDKLGVTLVSLYQTGSPNPASCVNRKYIELNAGKTPTGDNHKAGKQLYYVAQTPFALNNGNLVSIITSMPKKVLDTLQKAHQAVEGILLTLFPKRIAASSQYINSHKLATPADWNSMIDTHRHLNKFLGKYDHDQFKQCVDTGNKDDDEISAQQDNQHNLKKPLAKTHETPITVSFSNFNDYDDQISPQKHSTSERDNKRQYKGMGKTT